jgi:hypothetical protein
MRVIESSKNHIPSDFVADHWTSDGESSSHRDVLLLHDVWTTSKSSQWLQNNFNNINGLSFLPLNPVESGFFDSTGSIYVIH